MNITTLRPWTHKELPVQERVLTLLSAMTLEEKIGQMWQATGDVADRDRLVRDGKVGS